MSHEGASHVTPARVLVTGGSGFIAGHCILQLLEQGHLVRTTVRALAKEGAVRAVLDEAGLVNGDHLRFAPADLTRDDGWDEAVAGIDFVLHVASPVRPGHVEDPDDLIVPAREGTLRVLRAARDAGVKRVVLTSAFHAVSWGHPHGDHTFAEEDWTVLDGPGVDAYGRSKTLAERAAWDFMAREGGTMELATMLPVAVMGPVMGRDISGANHIVAMMLDGKMPGFPRLFIPIVDVRDVAAAHVLAMKAAGAAGERFLLSNGPAIAMKEIGATIRAELGEAAKRVPTRAIPDLVVRLGALFSARFRAIAPDLGYAKRTSNEKARRVLGWTARDPHEAVVAAAESIVAQRAAPGLARQAGPPGGDRGT
ncbi:SDR family oxidoreductase [Anaeromyxobacter paludicola]|uniref:Dihydroflavonol-4-reductase n=1 Tax=Anaeromyxobacter paludicola TaxID=2918171 RepID=A0ABN6NF15_9BACT|nr:aldehyde reductase [Anaeromyxobacter paludicola]BDG10769.1 dihydroflavonol-4-reductase [Anaeromyxobacter paludicola]